MITKNICKTGGALLIASATTLVATGAAQAASINLSTWNQYGTPGNGNWTVQGGGDSVLQTINGNPTFFVSPDNFINTEFNGKFEVETTGDDDYIGFVFGYQSPLNTSTNYDYLLFDWKQNTQPFGGQTAQEGFSLNRVNGNISSSGDILNSFWGHNNSAEFDVLATDFGSDRGWEDNTEYDFTLLYQTNRVKIDIAGGAFGAGETIFDVAGTFQDGRFGFYNYSQASVRYQGFTQVVAPPLPPNKAIPEPGSVLGSSLALIGIGGFLFKRKRDKNNTATKNA